MSVNNYPKLHNAMWPGLVGKGPDSEPPIDLDTMDQHTPKAQVDGQKFKIPDVTGDANKAYDPLLTGLHEGLQCTSWAQSLLTFFRVVQAVYLVQVQIIRLQALQ